MRSFHTNSSEFNSGGQGKKNSFMQSDTEIMKSLFLHLMGSMTMAIINFFISRCETSLFRNPMNTPAFTRPVALMNQKIPCGLTVNMTFSPKEAPVQEIISVFPLRDHHMVPA